MDNEKQKLIEAIRQKRGYVLSFHKILAEEDPDFLKCYEDLISAAYTREGELDKKVKEFVFIAALTALSAGKKHIGAHIRLAVENGGDQKRSPGSAGVHLSPLWNSETDEWAGGLRRCLRQ